MTLSVPAASIRSMAAPTPTRHYDHPQATVEVDEAGAFLDCGRWREKGITHWHLVYEEWQLKDNAERFNNERARAASLRRDEVAFSPQEALDWLEKSARGVAERSPNRQVLLDRAMLHTENDWWVRAETAFFNLMHGHSAGGGLLIAEGRAADSMAYAMTDRECTACTR